jgi:Nuclease-related domain
MSDYLPPWLPANYLLPLILVALLLLLLLLYWRRRSRRRSLGSVFSSIAFERIDGLVVPNADEGEIQIDHLLLTAHGLLIVDVKDVTGTVFGSDKMQEWTVISSERRFTFPSPQPALYDRIAALREIVGQVPVAGRILFLDGASFTKGVPSLVCSLDDLLQEFAETDRAAAGMKVESFKPHWETLRAHVKSSRLGKITRYRQA